MVLWAGVEEWAVDNIPDRKSPMCAQGLSAGMASFRITGAKRVIDRYRLTTVAVDSQSDAPLLDHTPEAPGICGCPRRRVGRPRPDDEQRYLGPPSSSQGAGWRRSASAPPPGATASPGSGVAVSVVQRRLARVYHEPHDE